jgi:tRNA pseudouridine38-40 synthase
MRNLKLTLSYDGSDFNGWQTQPEFRTVQETLEKAITAVTSKKVYANASGRTDAGVHAIGQVVNFYSDTRLAPEVLLRALNAHLPDDVAVSDCCDATQSFDANKDALRKLYRYVILDSPVRSPFMHRYAAMSRHRLDAPAMARASQCLVGRHDFHSFETEWPNRLTSIRTVTQLSVNRVGAYVWIDVEADGFLYNMVRAVAGTLINVGRGYWPEEKVVAILNAEDRAEAGPTAPARGLFLMRVTYSEGIERLDE